MKGLNRKQLLCVNGAHYILIVLMVTLASARSHKTVCKRGYCNVCLLKLNLQKSGIAYRACFSLSSHTKETPHKFNMRPMSHDSTCGSESVAFHPSPLFCHTMVKAYRWLALFVSSLPFSELHSPLVKKTGPGTHKREMGA